MKKIIMSFLFFLIVLCLTSVSLAVDISGCTQINTPGQYTLNQDIIDSSTSQCMRINADNVVLDCQNHVIDSDGTAYYGIYSYNRKNIEIKNCVVKEWNQYNIYFQSVHDSRMVNVESSGSSFYGIYLHSSSGNTLESVTSNHNKYYGIYLYSSSGNTLESVTSNHNKYYGIYLHSSSGNIITKSSFINNSNGGMYIYSSVSNTNPNLIYNNYFNNSQNIYANVYLNNLNTSVASGTNIIGGLNIGGNFWATPSGTGTSESCADKNSDGFCDWPFSVNSKNIDYHPLTNRLGAGITDCIEINYPGTYELDGDIINSSTPKCINIKADDVVFDCQGHVIDGDGSASYGIYSNGRKNLEIKNCIVKEWNSANVHFYSVQDSKITNVESLNSSYEGIYLYSSTNNTIEDTTINHNRRYGIYLQTSTNNTIKDTTANYNTQYGIYLYPSSNNNIIEDTTADDNIYGGFSLSYSDMNKVVGCSATDNGNYGYLLQYSDDNIISDSLADSNIDGFRLQYSTNNAIIGSVARSNTNGIYFLYASSKNNTVDNCSIEDNEYGVRFSSTTENYIKNSTIISNQMGVWLESSTRNSVTGSYIGNNNVSGIHLRSSGNNGPNSIYNNIFNNTINHVFDGSLYENDWRTIRMSGNNIVNGPHIGGNYWATPIGDGFSETCSEGIYSGLCNGAYLLEVGNIDYFPLTIPSGEVQSPPEQSTLCPACVDNPEDNSNATVCAHHNCVPFIEQQMRLVASETGGKFLTLSDTANISNIVNYSLNSLITNAGLIIGEEKDGERYVFKRRIPLPDTKLGFADAVLIVYEGKDLKLGMIDHQDPRINFTVEPEIGNISSPFNFSWRVDTDDTIDHVLFRITDRSGVIIYEQNNTDIQGSYNISSDTINEGEYTAYIEAMDNSGYFSNISRVFYAVGPTPIIVHDLNITPESAYKGREFHFWVNISSAFDIVDVIITIHLPDGSVTQSTLTNPIHPELYEDQIDTEGTESGIYNISLLIRDKIGNILILSNITSFEVINMSYKLKIIFVPVRYEFGRTVYNNTISTILNPFIQVTNLSGCRDRILIEDIGYENNYWSLSRDTSCSNAIENITSYIETIGYNPLNYDFIIALTHLVPANGDYLCTLEGAHAVGVAHGGSNLIFSSDNPVHVVAHELAHKFGLWDEYCSMQAGSQDPRCNNHALPLPWTFNMTNVFSPPNNLTVGENCDPYYHESRTLIRSDFFDIYAKFSNDAQDCCFMSCNASYPNICCLGNSHPNPDSTRSYSIMTFANVEEYVYNASQQRVFLPSVKEYFNTIPKLRCDEE